MKLNSTLYVTCSDADSLRRETPVAWVAVTPVTFSDCTPPTPLITHTAVLLNASIDPAELNCCTVTPPSACDTTKEDFDVGCDDCGPGPEFEHALAMVTAGSDGGALCEENDIGEVEDIGL